MQPAPDALADDTAVPERRVTPVERVRERMRTRPRIGRLWRWLGPALVVLLAGVLRLWNLAHPHALVFDETYYAKDAWTLLHLGYEGSWPADPDAAFLAGDVFSFLPEGSFVVHPPLGKWLIALGLGAFGADSAWGWRIAIALAATATVLVVILIGRRLTGSTLWGCVAGFLLAIDGLGIVLGRIALLDGLLALLVALAFLFLLIDRDRMQTRIAWTAGARGAGGMPVSTGPVMWARPWLVAAGATLGAAAAVKWSGVYVLAAAGIYVVVSDALARRHAGIDGWASDAAVRQGPVSFLLLVPVAAAPYLASWSGWLLTGGGYDRDSAENPLVALWNYHEAIYRFHVGLTVEHSYASPAWQWPLLLRPTSMFWEKVERGTEGCDMSGGCVQAISSVPNPLIWYAGMAAIVFLAIRLAWPGGGRVRDWRAGFVLAGVAATYVPWLLYPERTIFQFYTVVMMPFVVLALMLALQRLAGRPDAAPERRAGGQGVVAVVLAVAVLLTVFWYPVWTATEVPYDFWRLHNWMISWI
ncbi:dolichyl-phosphate-mannose--protein mannosyltransferase [Microbacterium sp. NPDC078428]|uniref:dolichyl-phosphate-mannose--protein mannosyltransferase n=1 Tax=Microbacterium sp. NPDC078428 TaxID=3364190 RepID=UPI0037C91B76